MVTVTPPQWASISREERFFTCLLFHDIRTDAEPLWSHIIHKLPREQDATIIDVGYEVCLFRDAFLAQLVERERDLEKQTFDLALTLSSRAVVLVEAKAQQGYTLKQLSALQSSKGKLEQSMLFPFKTIYLAGLFSSLYKPRVTTLKHFDWFLYWRDIATIYPHNAIAYERADIIYQDR